MMKILQKQPTLFHEEVALDLEGPSMLEIREAVSLLCTKYGAEVGLLVDVLEPHRKDVLAFFLAKKVNVTFRETAHPGMCVALCTGVVR